MAAELKNDPLLGNLPSGIFVRDTRFWGWGTQVQNRLDRNLLLLIG